MARLWHVMEAVSFADDLPISLARLGLFAHAGFPDLGDGLRKLVSVTEALSQRQACVTICAPRDAPDRGTMSDSPLQARHLEIAVGDALVLSEAVNIGRHRASRWNSAKALFCWVRAWNWCWTGQNPCADVI